MDDGLRIRDIDPASVAEVDLVARRMRQTLVEVEGEEAGRALYTLQWLRDRVRWHLDPASTTGRVFVAEGPGGRVLGHAIVRIEADDSGRRFGLFSTLFVDPGSRKQAVGTRLLRHGEVWMASHALPEAATWTSSTNAKLIGLCGKHGYAITARHVHEVTGTVMVRLAKPLEGGASDEARHPT